MKQLTRVLLIVSVLLVSAVAQSADAATPLPGAAEHPVLGPAGHRVVHKGDQLAALAPARTRTTAAAAGAAGAAPFLTRPYWNPHDVTSVFDHCNPDYTRDGRICEYDGTVAISSNGVDPTFSAGYAVTPRGTDYLYYDGHNGWDLALSYENIFAAAPGVVQISGVDPNNPGFGYCITIDHGNGFTTRYAHLSQLLAQPGQAVARGQVIAVSGNTGTSTGPHLHFGLYVTNPWAAIDPWGWAAGYADPNPPDSGDLWLMGNPQNPIPWAPASVSATPAFQGANLSWTRPAFDGGDPLDHYTITPSPGGSPVNVPADTTSTVIHGLQAAVSYTFSVVAYNVAGRWGPPATSAGVTPIPVQFTAPAAAPSSTDFDVAWNGPSGATYDLSSSEDGAPALPLLSGSAQSSYHFYGLAGHSFAFAVTGHGAAAGAALSTTVAIPSTAAYPAQFRTAVALGQHGEVHPIHSEPINAPALWNWDIGRAVATLPSGDGGYFVDGFGGLHAFGATGSPVLGAAYWPGWDIARDVVLTPDGKGGYVLDGFGGLHPFGLGQAPPPALASNLYWPGWDIARRVVLSSDGLGGYILDGLGGVHPVGTAPAVASADYFGWNIARGITLIPGTASGFVLDGWGGLHPFAGVGSQLPARPASSGYRPGTDSFRGILIGSGATPGSPAGYALDLVGGIHAFGGAQSLTVTLPTPLADGASS